MSKVVFTGFLSTYINGSADIGTEWIVEEPDSTGFDGTGFVQDGDLLTIFNDQARKTPLWQGTVKLDRQINIKPNAVLESAKSTFKVQAAGPFSWVNGIQTGVDPDQWGQWFAEKKPATLVKKATAPAP